MDAVALEAGIAKYGAAEAHQILGRVKRPEKKTASPALIIGCVIVPWLIFVITYYILSFFLRYWVPFAAYTVAAITLLTCLSFFMMVYGAVMGRGGDPLWLGLLCLLSILGWIWAVSASSGNFSTYMQPYFDLQQLNVYQSVDPSQSEGNQYMDFGVIKFVEKARIDRAFSMAFKNDMTYCVAPVKLNNTNPATYDFWAVGTNCCSSHLYDFRCGQWNDPLAHSGLRVVSETARPFYQLAAEQAAAAFDIKVTHPVFFEWVTDPGDVIDGYQEDGFKNFIDSAFYFFFVEVVVLVVAAWCFSKA